MPDCRWLLRLIMCRYCKENFNLMFHNPSQSWQILIILLQFWFTVASLCFFYLSKLVVWGVLDFRVILYIAKSHFKTYHCIAPHLITSKTTLPWQLRVVSSAVDFVSVPVVRQIYQQFPASGAAETGCMVTSHFILIKFGHDDHITFRDGLETRLASLRKIQTTKGELMNSSQPSLLG